MHEERDPFDARLERLENQLTYTCGFLQGIAARIESWRRWDSGEGDSASFERAAAEIRAYTANLEKVLNDKP